MQTLPFNIGRPAISSAHTTTTAQPSSAHPASATPNISQPNISQPNISQPNISQPNISQPNCDRWTELPVDVVEQVMYWSMLQSGSSTSATSFALTSTCFAQAGKSFRASSWYQEARSVLMHDRTMSWTRTYIRLLGYNRLIRAPRDLEGLNVELKIMERAGKGMPQSLNIEHQQPAQPGTDYLEGFRNFRGTALSLLTGVLERTHEEVIEIARVLPAKVCLYVEFSLQVFRPRVENLGVAKLVSRVAMSGRPTAFNLKRSEELSTRPDELGAVLDVACGPGMVSFLHFGRIDNPDAMLSALSDRCHRFHDLKLVMFDCERAPTRDALLGLVAAMEKRNSAARSRLTVVIDCAGLPPGSEEAAPLFSADELAACEHAGLYVERLESGALDDEGQRKVLASVKGEPARALLTQPLMVESDLSSDSSALMASSDSDDWSDSSGDEAQAEQAGRQLPESASQRRAVQRPASQVVKRDFCVIS